MKICAPSVGMVSVRDFESMAVPYRFRRCFIARGKAAVHYGCECEWSQGSEPFFEEERKST
eukprot:5907027-Prymnesium_polylepis.1